MRHRGYTETAGRICQTSAAKNVTSAIATTNSGSAVTARAMTESPWSNQLSRRAAASMPSTTPITVPMTPASSMSTAVLSTRPPISELTDALLTIEVPKLPCSNPVSQLQYCATADRFRCIWISSACRRAGVAVFCSAADAALPGSTCVAANTRIETMNSVRMPKPSRLTKTSLNGCALGARAAGAIGAGAVTSAMTGDPSVGCSPGQLSSADPTPLGGQLS